MRLILISPPLYVIVSLLALSLLTTQTLERDFWSLRYLANAFDPLSHKQDIPPAPINHPRGVLWLAKLALIQGRYEDVITITETLALSEDVEISSLVINAYLKLGNYEKAIEVWKQSEDRDLAFFLDQVRQNADSPDGVLIFLMSAYEIDKEEFALSLVEKLIEHGEAVDATEILHDVLSSYRGSEYRYRWFQKLVYLLRVQRKWPDALVALSEWSIEFPDDIDYLIQLGWVYHEGYGDRRKAFGLFDRAIFLAPDNGAGYLSKGRLLSYEENFMEAETYFNEAVRLYTDGPAWLLLERANNLRSSGDLTGALVLYGDIVERYPDYSFGFYEQAWAYYLDNQYDHAWNALAIALQMLSNFDEVGSMRAMLIADQTGHTDQAVFFAKEVLRMNSKNGEALEVLNRLLAK